MQGTEKEDPHSPKTQQPKAVSISLASDPVENTHTRGEHGNIIILSYLR